MNVHTLPSKCARAEYAGVRNLLSLREVVTLAEIPEKRVRKDIETGILTSPNVYRLGDARLCFNWGSVFTLAAVYGNVTLPGAMRKIALNRVYDAELRADFCYRSLNGFAMFESKCVNHGPSVIAVDRYLSIDLAAVCENLLPKVALYMHGLKAIEERADVLGGEAVFKGSRLSVFHVGKMVENGEAVENILEDYPYLSDADVQFALIYCRAHPPVGRPRTDGDSGADAKASTR